MIGRVAIVLAVYFLAWGLTATIGVHLVSRAAVQDPFCTMGQNAGCDAKGYAPGPFLVHVDYNLGGGIVHEVSQTTLWLLGIRVPLRAHRPSM